MVASWGQADKSEGVMDDYWHQVGKPVQRARRVFVAVQGQDGQISAFDIDCDDEGDNTEVTLEVSHDRSQDGEDRHHVDLRVRNVPAMTIYPDWEPPPQWADDPHQTARNHRSSY